MLTRAAQRVTLEPLNEGGLLGDTREPALRPAIPDSSGRAEHLHERLGGWRELAGHHPRGGKLQRQACAREGCEALDRRDADGEEERKHHARPSDPRHLVDPRSRLLPLALRNSPSAPLPPRARLTLPLSSPPHQLRALRSLSLSRTRAPSSEISRNGCEEAETS
eukprot:scaffold126375_cov30-Tisochrysis_lutea.AAC.1